jgi:hypothetical protein
MSTRRRTRLALLVPAVLLSLIWPAAAQAAPAPQEIGLSSDGVTWASELTVPLFEPERRWVPGDDETRTFQLRNDGPSAASMTVEVLSPGGDGAMTATVSISLRVDGGAWTPLELGSTPRSVTVDPLAVDDAAPVDLRATFDPASGNSTQNGLMPLTLRITLVGDVPSDAGEDAGPGSIADTGTTVHPEVLLVALGLCLAGALLIARRHLERGDGSDEAAR